ncbi:MAG: hypothetical protein GOV15_00500, partial [Candidatus Diapherotrites archaeon]|nr:hypothetical protein [Candidatus Diapherotrites archaeon]
IKDCLKKTETEYDQVKRLRGRILIKTGEPLKAAEKVARVFGVSSTSPAVETQALIGPISEHALNAAKSKQLNSKKTFRVSTKRSTKQSKYTSNEVNREIGAFLEKQTKGRVQLKAPDVEIGIEIINDKAYVFADKYAGPGGLPLGIEGRVLCVMDHGMNSVVAAWLMMKRGAGCFFIYPGEIPETHALIEKFAYGQQTNPFIYTDEKNEVINSIAEEYEVKALVTGETLDEIKTSTLKTDKVVLRPLTGYSKEQIKQIYTERILN